MKLNHPERFANEFLEKYLQNGFGSMGKKDVELLVLYLILEDGNSLENPDLDMLSFELKIPKSKLKNLYYEMRLRYSSDEEINISKSAAEIIKRTLSSGLYEISEEGLKLMIANPYDRHILEAFFRNNGMTYDYSFSKDILKLTPEKFKIS